MVQMCCRYLFSLAAWSPKRAGWKIPSLFICSSFSSASEICFLSTEVPNSKPVLRIFKNQFQSLYVIPYLHFLTAFLLTSYRRRLKPLQITLVSQLSVRIKSSKYKPSVRRTLSLSLLLLWPASVGPRWC